MPSYFNLRQHYSTYEHVPNPLHRRCCTVFSFDVTYFLQHAPTLTKAHLIYILQFSIVKTTANLVRNLTMLRPIPATSTAQSLKQDPADTIHSPISINI